MRCRWPSWIALLVCGGCESALSPSWQQPRRVPLPRVIPSVEPTGTPLPPFIGDGLDGDTTFLSGNANSVNDCRPVTLGTASTVTVAGDSSVFLEGRLVLLHQSMDAYAALSDPGPYLTPGNAGL